MRESEKVINKRYGVTFVLMVLLWAWVAFVLITIEPSKVADVFITGSYIPLVLPLFLATLFLFSLILGNVRRGLLFSGFVTLSFYLRVHKIAQWWVILALLVSVIFVEIFWSLKKVDKQE